jgi:hypothetical protein
VTASALASIPQALVRPDTAFSKSDVFRFPKPVIALFLFLLYVLGLRLAAGFDQNPHAKELAVAEVAARLGAMMANAPPEAQKKVRDQALSQILGSQGGIMTAVSIVISGLLFVGLILELWLLCAIVTQFFGGQEERHGRERPSLTLFMTAFLPLALRKLLQGIVLSFRNPEIASNALTLTEYRSMSAVRFDLFSFLPPLGLPSFVATLLKFATDPFVIWTFAVLAFGGREIYRISMKSAVGQSAVLLLILCLQFTLFARIGIPTEL